MKELTYSNFQLTRSTSAPTTFTIDGVSIEMRKRGGTPAPAKAKKPRRQAKKASPAKEPAPEQPAKKSKPAAVRRTEATPQ